jgi:hypothetical protein
VADELAAFNVENVAKPYRPSELIAAITGPH